MRIWIFKPHEGLPGDGSGDRLGRVGLLSEALAQRGHDVTWWTSNFDHVRKVHRSPNGTTTKVGPNLKIVTIPSPGYRRNISISRIRDHEALGRNLERALPPDPPDLILSSMPIPEWALIAVRYGRRHRVPVVIDLRDMWPDIFLDVLPRWSRPLARVATLPLYRRLGEICSGSASLIGITPGFIDWGLSHAGRDRTEFDRHFWLAYAKNKPGPEDLETARKAWERRGLKFDQQKIFCFFGTMSRSFDIPTVIAAARRVRERDPSFTFVFCGKGDRLAEFQATAAGDEGILFPGWVGGADIWALMESSCAGLAPYINRRDFLVSIPNKAIEYLAAGLPIVTCLQGELKALIERRQCGKFYGAGDATALASIIEDLATNREARDALSANAMAAFDSEFAADLVYVELCKHLERVARNYQASATAAL